ncbi:IS5 family transposase [Streptomyces shenzhenensis]|uniref:IS5 family transposase n=1 Tax=Streptomyces shenzhenensis TaxID=943815 RepID=UPI0034098177
MGRGGLTDVEWERLRPFLPVSNRRCGRWRDHRQVIDGILHRVRTGVQWRDLPERFGPWKTAYERHRLWSADGTWERLLQQVQAEADAADDIDWDVSVDSTIVRAHQHAAGARTDPPSASKGGWARGTPGRDAVAEPRRPPGGGGAGGEGLGRSRGGFTTKVHLSADGRCRPLSLVVTPGQRADCTQFEPVLEKIRVPRIGPGRPRKSPTAWPPIRRTATGRVAPTCANGASGTRSLRRPTAWPLACARAHEVGGHRAFDEERYKKRNTVERAINKLKNARAVATRYDKRGYVYLGTITAAALVIWLHT